MNIDYKKIYEAVKSVHPEKENESNAAKLTNTILDLVAKGCIAAIKEYEEQKNNHG